MYDDVLNDLLDDYGVSIDLVYQNNQQILTRASQTVLLYPRTSYSLERESVDKETTRSEYLIVGKENLAIQRGDQFKYVIAGERDALNLKVFHVENTYIDSVAQKQAYAFLVE